MKLLLGCRLLAATALAAFGVAACAGSAPSAEDPFCGEPIDVSQVLVLDAEPLGQNPAAVAEFINEQAGPYRLVTDQPVGLLNGVPRTVRSVRIVWSASDEAAARGCNLMIVLGTQMTAKTASGGTPGKTIIAHLGVREGGPNESR